MVWCSISDCWVEKHSWQRGEKPGLPAVWCRWPVTSVGLMKPAFTMTMTSRLAWFRKQLDRVRLHLFSAKLLVYCCCQLSGCWLIFPACPHRTWLHINILCRGELIVQAHTQPLSLTHIQSNTPSMSAGERRPLWNLLMCTQGWGLGAWNYIQTIQSVSLVIITQINQILFG